MDKKIVPDIKERKFIRITDINLLQMIERISKEEKYSKSFNLIINDALFYGLPMLSKKLFGEVDDDFQEMQPIVKSTQGDGQDNEFYMQVVRLLKELILNETINKSMLSSIFNALQSLWGNEAVAVKKFAEGAYSSTPDYLESFELKGLKELRGNKK